MFIGEGPGYHEDKQGRPFVGAAGQFLNELLELAGLDRSTVYIANVVKCRPPNNRDPEPEEMAACAPYLERQIALIKPRVIVTLGRFSMSRFFPASASAESRHRPRGRWTPLRRHVPPCSRAPPGQPGRCHSRRLCKLPIYLEQAKRLGAPAPEAAGERVEEAEQARAEVVHEPETAAVLQEDIAPERIAEDTQHVNIAGPAVEVIEQEAPEAVPTTVAAAEATIEPQAAEINNGKSEKTEKVLKPRGKGKAETEKAPGKPEQNDKGYEQLSLF